MMQYIEIMKRMNRFCRMIPFVGVCLAMASCNDMEGASGLGSQPVALGISAVDVPDRPATRAGVTTGTIGIYMTKSDYYPSITNRTGNYASGWTPSSTIWLNNKDAELAVVWPQQSGTATFSLSAAEWNSSDDIYSGKRPDVNNRNGDKLEMKNLTPVYTRLKLTVSKVDTYNGPGEWTKLALSGGNLYQKGEYNPLTETVTGQSGKGYTETFSKSIDSGEIDLRLLPVGALTEDLKVTLTVDGKDMEVTVPKKSFNETKMQRGICYELAVKVSTVGVTVGALAYTEWSAIPGEISSGTEQTNK